MKLIIIAFALVITNLCVAQELSPCVSEVLKLENKIFAKKFREGEQPLYVNYDIKTIDWDNKSINTNVKIYRGAGNMHFFSNQADIYHDKDDVLMVLKSQKVVLRDQSSEKIVSKGFSDDFIKTKKIFLSNCTVLSCKDNSANKGEKIIQLKANTDLEGALYIDKMTYVYNQLKGEIISSTIVYKKGYKIKQIELKYNALEMNSDYKFFSAKKYVVNKKDELLAKYSGFELIDNRTKK